MHREKLVVSLGREGSPLRPNELKAHEESLGAAHQQEHQRGDQIASADLLVIDGRERSPQRRGSTPCSLQAFRQRAVALSDRRRVCPCGNYG